MQNNALTAGLSFTRGAAAITRAHTPTHTTSTVAEWLDYTITWLMISIFTAMVYSLEGSQGSRFEDAHSQLEATASRVRALWNNVEPLTEFSYRWELTDNVTRHAFVKALDSDHSENAERLKRLCAKYIYQKVKNNDPVTEWPAVDAPTFYHTTSVRNASKILASGKVMVMHQKAYKGAFVSTKPEWEYQRYGECIFVFNRSIQHLSALAKNEGSLRPNGSCVERGHYWAGFSEEIPVNQDTLVKIIIHCVAHEFEEMKAEVLSKKHCCGLIKTRVGWEGLVVERFKSYAELRPKPVPIPIEWPKSE